MNDETEVTRLFEQQQSKAGNEAKVFHRKKKCIGKKQLFEYILLPYNKFYSNCISKEEILQWCLIRLDVK